MSLNPSRLLRLAIIALALAAPRFSAAQSRDTVRESVVRTLEELRSAVTRKDWAVMSRVLPANSRWRDQIEQLVRDQTAVFSFWAPGSRLPLDSLTIVLSTPGTATVEGPLFVGSARGYWYAEMQRVDGRWQFITTREEWAP